MRRKIKRYYREVKLLDSGKLSIRDFILSVINVRINNRINEADAIASYRIYVEDGGKRYTINDFLNVVEEFNISREDALNLAQEFLNMKL